MNFHRLSRALSDPSSAKGYLLVLRCVCFLKEFWKFLKVYTRTKKEKKKEENSAYFGLTTTTLSRQLTMHLNDPRTIAFQLKNNSIPNCWNILVENTTIIAHEIDKLRLQILEAVHIKAPPPKKTKINRIHFEKATMFWNALRIHFYPLFQ